MTDKVKKFNAGENKVKGEMPVSIPEYFKKYAGLVLKTESEK